MKTYGSMPIRTTTGSGESSYKTYKTVEIGSQTWMAEDVKNFASPKYDYNNGVLYKFAEANSTTSPLCSQDWRLPSQFDWQKLINFVGNDINKLKAMNGWNNGNGTDDYGFAAKPSGSSCDGATREYVGTQGHWWASSNYNSADSAYKFIISDTGLNLKDEDKKCFLSVRCVKDN